MIALLKTAERANNNSFINNYVFQRHLFAYKEIPNEYLRHKNVLELGCGEGYGMESVAPEANFYLAVDKKKPSHDRFPANTSFQKCKLPQLTKIADQSFDTVICFQVIEHIKDDHRLLLEIRRVLRPGGYLLLTTPNRCMSLTRNPFHIREYLPEEIETLIAEYFRTSQVEGIYGNRRVMSYYEENRRSVRMFERLDVFRLRERLPLPLLRILYTLFNNINRYLLLRKVEDLTGEINFDDFYRHRLSQECLDYFITAGKS